MKFRKSMYLESKVKCLVDSIFKLLVDTEQELTLNPTSNFIDVESDPVIDAKR